MKGHHEGHHREHERDHMKHGGHRKHRETGGVNEAEEDLKERPEARTNASHIDREAEEMKRGGHARKKRRRGGVVHHEKMEHMKHAKHVGKVHGEVHHHAGRKPRKDGGRTGADAHPFSSARKSTPAPGRKVQTEFEGADEA